MTAPGDPYARFRATADVADWAVCLDQLLRSAPPADPGARAERLAQTICVAVYLEWLARISGDLDTQERTGQRIDELRQQLLDAGRPIGAHQRLCWVPLLIRDGYGKHADQLLDQLVRELPQLRAAPEWQVLRHQNRDVDTLVGLRELVRGPKPTTFLPAVFEYALAMVHVGAVHEAARLIAAGPWDPKEPFLRDVRGGIGERLGEWASALDAYTGSPWPTHIYRAAVVGTIAGQPERIDALRFDDEPVRRVLFQLDGDLDQAEMARSAAFLTACLWHPIVNWILELELGKLSFRRRRFAEADVHYQRALAVAPADARLGIAGLRFLNLTWLTENVAHAPLNLQPEALVAGHESLSPDGQADATTRIWMASETRDLSLLPPSLDGWSAYDRADAYDVIGDLGRAMDAWLESLQTSYNHRAAKALIRQLYRAGLTRAAVRLADVLLTASGDDFLALWETGLTVQQLLLAAGSAEAAETAETGETGTEDEVDDVSRVADRYRERLLELSQFEFMNALRSHELVLYAGYEDLAEELLLRVAKQAESVSELLAIAVLRRISPIRSMHSDQEGLWCLARAHRLARDRRERLEVAREYIHYDAVREGRAILAEENVLHEGTALSHSEMIVALQCGRGCTPAERDAMAVRAVHRLNEDFAAGNLGPYPATYAERLLETLRTPGWPTRLWVEVSGALAPGLRASLPEVPWGGVEENQWLETESLLNGIVDADPEPDDDWLTELPGVSSFGLRILTITNLRSGLDDAQEAARGGVPVLPVQEVPIARAIDNGDGPRTIQLCDLWRSRLARGGAQTDELREFLAEEQQLLQQWEQQRAEAGAGHLRRVVRVGRMLHTALNGLLTTEQLAEPHPVLGPVFTAIKRDVRSLTAEIAEQVRTAESRLAGTSSATTTGVAP